MLSRRRIPIFDGHNDVLLRLWRRGVPDVVKTFLEGETEGQLDFPKAWQGGFAGGLFAIFVPSADRVPLPTARMSTKQRPGKTRAALSRRPESR